MIYVARRERNRLSVFAVGNHGVTRLAATDDPTDLARVLLAEASCVEPAPDVCRRFADEVIARVPHDGFALPRDTVDAWLQRVVTV